MITPLDIENKKFSKQMMNGYNVEEVDDFLDDLTVEYSKNYKEIPELKSKVEELTKSLEHYKNIESTLQNTLIMAQSTAEDIKNVIAHPLQSKNAFALDLTPTCVVSSVTPNGAVSDPTATLSKDGIVTYSMTNGIYDMSYTTGLKAVDNSFNTYDTKGQYQAILTLSKTSI